MTSQQTRRARAMRRKPFWPMIDRVHRGHDRQQDLRGADIAGRLVAADMLLARLQGETVGGFAVCIDGDADEAAGHGALVVVFGGHEGGVRAAIAHGHAKALAVADDDVRAKLAGRPQQDQRQQVGGDDHERARFMGAGSERLVIEHVAIGGRVLQQHAKRGRLKSYVS